METYTDCQSDLLTNFVRLEEDDFVISDVHLFANGSSEDAETIISRFVFFDRIDRQPADRVDLTSGVDEDGDIIREQKPEKSVIYIEHRLSTRLRDVGAQVWRGALYLGDFLLENRELFRDREILELGAGVGLLAALADVVGCGRYFATDAMEEALLLAQNNIRRNNVLVSSSKAHIRRLDWLKPGFELRGFHEDAFKWNEEEVSLLRSSGFLVLAADVIYSDELTDGFFRTLVWLSDFVRSDSDITVYLAMEKRLVFTIDELKVCSPPYKNFLRNISELSERLSASLIEEEVKQHFEYDRVEELELWQIVLHGNSDMSSAASATATK